MVEPLRLAIVTTHPIQYHVPLWRALQRDGRVEPRVLFLSRHGAELRTDPNFGVSFAWDVDLLGGYSSSFIPNRRIGGAPGRFASYLNPDMIAALSRAEPDAVLFSGLYNPSALTGMFASRWRGLPCLYRAESSILGRRTAISRNVGGWLVRRNQGVLPIGTANDLYYDAVGYPESRRFLAPYTVDNEFFRRQATDRAAARTKLGLEADQFVVLYVGKLAPWKDPLVVVEACAELARHGSVRVLVAGDGVLRSELHARAAQMRVPLTHLGFVNQSQLGISYSAADVLVLPSLVEPWGLAVNEAMNFSLPIVVSSRVGARLDLVRPGDNGAVVPPRSAAALAVALTQLAEDPELAAAWGRESRRLIECWGLDESVAGVVEAVRAVV